MRESIEVRLFEDEAKAFLSPEVGRGNDMVRRLLLKLPVGSLEMNSRTRVGHSLFVPEPDSARCSDGHVIGFTMLSEVYIQRSSLTEVDWFHTRQFLGQRMGPYRPHPLLLISQRLHQFLVTQKVKRFDVEVAHLV